MIIILKKQLVFIILLLFVLLSAGPGHSMEDRHQTLFDNFYIDISGGANFPVDSNVRGGSNLEMNFDTGYGFSASLGYEPSARRGFLSRARFEAEASYHSAEIDNRQVAGRGNVSAAALMFNTLYDLENASFITPYVGVGFGVVHLKLEDNLVLNAINETDIVPAYQFMAGLAYDPEPAPFATWHLGYRFLGASSDATFQNNSTGVESKYEYSTHAVELGVRLDF